MDNKRTLEYFIMGGILAIGAPCALLLGHLSGEATGAIAYPKTQTPVTMAIDYKPLVLGSADDAESGRRIFQTNCTACHGPNADGKGAAAAALTPPPRDFTDPKARWTRGREPMEIYTTLSEGSPGTAMVGFANSMSIQDRWALVHYLGSLPGVSGQFKPVDEALAAAWKPETKR
ncbi:MAG: cytochrome c [Fibrobacteria bacterium]